MIIVVIMQLNFAKSTKRIISLVLMLLLTIVYCGSIDLSCDALSSGGGIKGSGNISVVHSLIAPSASAVHEDNTRGTDRGQNVKGTYVSSDIISRLAQKICKYTGNGMLSESAVLFRRYSLSICISIYAYLFLLTNVSFIHRKDGSK